MTEAALKELLGNGNVTLTITASSQNDHSILDIKLNSGYSLQAPFDADDIVGTASIYYRGVLMDTVDLVPYTAVGERTRDITAEAPDTGFKVTFGLVLAILAGAMLIYYVLSYIYLNINRRRRRAEAAAGKRPAASQDPVIVTIIKNLLRNRK